jgi:hypothetical protein
MSDHRHADHRTVTPGRYRHYKGGEYDVLGVALLEATLEPHVIYRPVHGWPDDVPAADAWLRPLLEFTETLADGQLRFRRIS